MFILCTRCKNTINRQRRRLPFIFGPTNHSYAHYLRVPKTAQRNVYVSSDIAIHTSFVDILFCEKNKLKFSNSSCSSYRSTKTDGVTSNVWRIFSFSGPFHQHVYAQLLLMQIPPKSAKSCLTWLSFLCYWVLRP